jgi:circadian clock protein KaiB
MTTPPAAKGKAKTLLRLRLYIAGNAPNSARAVVNCNAICAAHFEGAFELEIVDSFVDPERALADGIIVTPTLLKLAPAPAGRVIGNLSDTNQVLISLGAA